MGTGGQQWVVDGFPACDEGQVWNSVRDFGDLDGVSYDTRGAVESVHAAVTVSGTLELALEKGFYAATGVWM